MERQAATITDWTELGIFDRIPQGVNSRHFCPECHPHRKPENRRDRDFVIAPNNETGFCQHCYFTANIRTRGHGEPPLPEKHTPIAPSAMVDLPQDEPKAPPPTPDTNPASLEHWEPILAERGLDAGILAQEFGVRFIHRSDIGHTMVIPQRDPETGELLNHKYRGENKQFRNDPGTRHPMYNLHSALGAEAIVIVEGEMDVYAVDMAGFPHVISVPDGAPNPGAKSFASAFNYLDDAMEFLLEADRIVIMVDNDAPGMALREELERRLGVVAHIHFPDGIKDANDALIHLGPEWIKDAIANAVPAPTSGVFTPMQAMGEIERALKFGFDTGTPIGFPELDQIYRPTMGHLTIITGHAGSGKSTVLDNIVMKLINKQWPVAFFSPEQMPVMRHILAMAEIWIGKPTTENRAKTFNMPQATAEEIAKFVRYIDPLISHISPEMADETPSLDKILELATTEVRRIGIKGLVIDPWNEIEVGRPPNITETEWVSVALGRIRRWGRKHNVHVWLVAHPKKMRSEDGVDAVPGLGDISGSNNFRNKADYGLTVHKAPGVILLPGNVSTVDIIVTKARWKDSAVANAKATFVYDPASNRIQTPPPTYASQVRYEPPPPPRQQEWDPNTH